MKRKKKKGFSLIEILLVLSILVTLITAAFLIYQKVKMNYDVQAEVDGAVSMSTEIKSAYKNSKSYYGIDNYFLYDIKAFPAHFSVDKSKFNSLSGTYSILGAQFLVNKDNIHLTESSEEQHGGDGAAFAFKYINLDNKYCMPFISKVYSYANIVQINSTVVKSDSTLDKTSVITKKFDHNLAQKLCSASNKSAIVLTFY